MPSSHLDDGFFTTSWGDGQRYFTTLDLNQDGFPDLIHSADPQYDNGQVWSDTDGAFWRVYPGSPNGFQRNHFDGQCPALDLTMDSLRPGTAMGNAGLQPPLSIRRKMMLIHTADSSREGGHVWRDADGPYWRVYSAE